MRKEIAVTRDMTNEQLQDIINEINGELLKRQQIKEEEAINKFREAFNALLDLGLDIIYEEEETGEYADLRDFNKFRFE